MGQFTPLRTFLAVKDSFDKHSAPTDAHIIIGTPGTVLDMIVKRKLDVKNIKAFVLDEADNMLDQQSLGEQTLRVKK
jgi:ATP-dependent RNA helicase DDX19/DBP5